jgi:hypothetical protein
MKTSIFSALRALLPVLVALSLALAPAAHAAIDIAPGETSAPLIGDGCLESSGAIVVDTFDCTADCLTQCEAASNTANASLDVSNLDVGKRYVVISLYSDFTVTGDSTTNGNPVSATVSYDLGWAGGWTLAGLFTGFNDVKSTMSIALADRTAGQTVQSSTFHTMTTDGFIGIDIIDAGFGLDKGSEASSMSVDLVRGHTYRVLLTLRIEGKGALNATVLLDYATGGWGLWWNSLTVSVTPDILEEIAKLWAAIDQLRHDLEHHTHTYLTGRGEGHNNTEATTSPAIIMDDSLVSPDELQGDLSQDGPSEALPEKSVLMHNYPNPFNASTRISYTLPEDGWVDIKIYNTLGQHVMTLLSEQQAAGTHEVPFDATKLASGVYYYRLTMGPYAETRRLTLLK